MQVLFHPLLTKIFTFISAVDVVPGVAGGVTISSVNKNKYNLT